MSFQPLEEMIYNGFLNTVGNPLFLGLLVLGVFSAFVLMQNTRTDAKVVILVPAFILASAFISPLLVLGGLALSVLLYLSVTKMMSR